MTAEVRLTGETCSSIRAASRLDSRRSATLLASDPASFDYLREGYPIASGIIEGSCRLVVEDRLDRTGMRWSLDGALAMLANRTTSLSDDWNDYQTFRITREQKRLYPTTT